MQMNTIYALLKRIVGFSQSINQFPNINLIYLFVSRHEVHSMNTHTLQNAG